MESPDHHLVSRPAGEPPHLEDFALRTLLEQQRLLVQRVQRLPGDLGLLLGHVGAVVQQVDFHVRSCRKKMEDQWRVRVRMEDGAVVQRRDRLTGEGFGSGLLHESSSSDHLHLQLALLLHHAYLDVT